MIRLRDGIIVARNQNTLSNMVFPIGEEEIKGVLYPREDMSVVYETIDRKADIC